jgi:two-component system, chemotaxis family, protein-glutamate methylesterase/glutaminase
MDKKKVLIVDDSSVMRLTIRNLIAKDQNLVIVGAAGNGKEALDQLDKLQPDLILLDIEMPEMDGLEFLRHARLKTRAKVVILSSLAGTDSYLILQ